MLDTVLAGLRSDDIEIKKKHIRMISSIQPLSFDDAKSIFIELSQLHQFNDPQIRMLCRGAICKLSEWFPGKFDVEFLFTPHKTVTSDHRTGEKNISENNKTLLENAQVIPHQNVLPATAEKRSTLSWIIILLIASFFLSKFYDDYQKTKDAQEATLRVLSSIKKIESAIEIGVNLSKFSELVVETKISVDQDIEKLDPEVKNEIAAALIVFNDARSLWQEKARGYFMNWSQVTGQIFENYGFEKMGYDEDKTTIDEALQHLFKLGLAHIKKASTIQGQ